jgi:hypothetical protein
MMQELINELADSALSRWMLDSFWAWPMLEILHFIGLSILLGSLLLFDLRLTGLFRSIPLTATRALLPWAIGGFAINLLSGVRRGTVLHPRAGRSAFALDRGKRCST